MRNRRTAVVPAVRPGLLSEQVGNECVVYDTESNEAHCLAPLAAAVFAHCDGRTRLADLPDMASTALGEPVGADDVDNALAQLDNAGLLIRLITTPDGISRRTFMRRTAVVTAGAAVLVTTISTPLAAQGASDARCPQARCVSQSDGDDFCGCANACPPDSPGGNPDKCATLAGLSGAFFDSCECEKCPTTADPNTTVPAAFLSFCPTPAVASTPCGGGGYPNGGCNDASKPMDGICVPQSGDSSEVCLTEL